MCKYKNRQYLSITRPRGLDNQAQDAGKLMKMCRLTLLSISLLATCSLISDGWVLRSAVAASKPKLSLKVTGPSNAQAGIPVDGIKIQIINPSLALKNSRLRLFIHDEQDRELQKTDISIGNQEQNSWKSLPVELIDGGVMAAIGEAGSSQKEHHNRGGFVIAKKANKVWHLQLQFRLPGRYSLVVAVSPDNGETHLATPAKISVVVL